MTQFIIQLELLFILWFGRNTMIQHDKVQTKRLELRDEIQRKVITKFPIQTELNSIIYQIMTDIQRRVITFKGKN